MKNYPEFAYFNTGIDSTVVGGIFKYVSENIELNDAGVGGEKVVVNKSIRNCLSGDIPQQYWLSGVLDYYIRQANDEIFHYDLVGWHDAIQFLLYEGKNTGYKWHSDISAPESNTGFRKLSIVLCLSSKDDYDGGELQLILDGHKEMETLKLDMGDCVIFPSTTLHRVRPLKSGERTTIVGWYGGPDFR